MLKRMYNITNIIFILIILIEIVSICIYQFNIRKRKNIELIKLSRSITDITFMAHAILPSIQSNKDIIQMLLAMRNEIFGGILSGWYFIYLQEKSKTLWFPVLIHALLDYSFSFLGALVAVVAFVYLKMKSKKCKLNSVE